VVSAGLGAALGVGVAIGAPILAVGILVTLAIGTNAGLKQVEADRKVEDPPRSDFWQPAFPRLVLPFQDAFGPSEFERALAIFSRITIETVSLENTMITVQERQLGAEAVKAEDAAELRGLELEFLRVATGRWNLQLAHQTRMLNSGFRQELLEDSEFMAQLREMPIPDWDEVRERSRGGVLRERHPEVLSTLEASGLGNALIYDLDLPEEPRPLADLAEELPELTERAALLSARYGQMLLDSVPDSGSIPSPPPLSFDARAFTPEPRYPFGFGRLGLPRRRPA
jgi:hypothetical protein